MRMSTKSRFAVNAMIDLGLREQAGPVPLAAIAERQKISLSYLEQLFARLRRSGLVDSTRGPGGGYRLGRPAAAVSMADIVESVEDPADDAQAVADAVWARLDAVMLQHMDGITLESLLAEQRARGVQVEPRQQRRVAMLQPLAKPLRSKAPNSVFAFARSLAD